jgi:hypothetical protein
VEYAVEERFGFEVALVRLEAGEKLQRVGWHNLGEFIFLVQGTKIMVSAGTPLISAFKEGTHIEQKPYIMRCLPPHKCMPWNATHTDLLSKDWRIS